MFTIEARQMLHGPEFAESRAILGCLAVSPSSGSQPATTHRTDHRRNAEILVTVGSDADANQHILRENPWLTTIDNINGSCRQVEGHYYNIPPRDPLKSRLQT